MKNIEFPKFTERIRGFTLPQNGTMIVFDYDEVFRLELRARSVEVLDIDPSAFETAHPDFFGVSANQPLLETANVAVSYKFDPFAESQIVRVVVNAIAHELLCRTLSGDWFVATLSVDERYLIIAEPYLFEVYELGTITTIPRHT